MASEETDESLKGVQTLFGLSEFMEGQMKGSQERSLSLTDLRCGRSLSILIFTMNSVSLLSLCQSKESNNTFSSDRERDCAGTHNLLVSVLFGCQIFKVIKAKNGQGCLCGQRVACVDKVSLKDTDS